MFGYLDVDKGKIEDGQRGLWQTFMCGLCMSTKNIYGNFPRTFISNDINFFNVLFHSVTQTDVELENKKCFSHPLKKRPILKTTPLTDELASANILLTYWNLFDDVQDGGSVAKKNALKLIKKAYGKARNVLPQTDEMLSEMYAELQSLEKSDCKVIDKVAHSFASLSLQFGKLVLKENSSENIETLCYNLGKWIYLIDALDDIEKDLKSGNYNVLVSCYNLKKATDIIPIKDEIQFIMYSVLNRIAQSYNDLNLTKYTCILKNVLYESIRGKTKEILDKYKPSKR